MLCGVPNFVDAVLSAPLEAFANARCGILHVPFVPAEEAEEADSAHDFHKLRSTVKIGSELGLHRDWAHPCHICGTGLTRANIGNGTGPHPCQHRHRDSASPGAH